MRQHIFVSYKREDVEFAESLVEEIENAGFTAWADSMISAGEEWRAAIDAAIRNSFALISVMTPEAKNSEYVTYEWAFALGVGVRVIPIMLRKTELHPRLDSLQYLDFTGSHVARSWRKLMDEVRGSADLSRVRSVSVPPDSPPVIRSAAAALDGIDHTSRISGVEALKAADSPIARDALVEALLHPMSDVRHAALESLNALDDVSETTKGPSISQALIPVLGRLDIEMRIEAIALLGRTREPSVIDKLVQLLSDGDQRVQLAALTSLSATRSQPPPDRLAQWLSHPDPKMREAAETALLRAKDPAPAIRLLDKVVNRVSRSKEERRAAERILQKLRARG